MTCPGVISDVPGYLFMDRFCTSAFTRTHVCSSRLLTVGIIQIPKEFICIDNFELLCCDELNGHPQVTCQTCMPIASTDCSGQHISIHLVVEVHCRMAYMLSVLWCCTTWLGQMILLGRSQRYTVSMPWPSYIDLCYMHSDDSNS